MEGGKPVDVEEEGMEVENISRRKGRFKNDGEEIQGRKEEKTRRSKEEEEKIGGVRGKEEGGDVQTQQDGTPCNLTVKVK